MCLFLKISLELPLIIEDLFGTPFEYDYSSEIPHSINEEGDKVNRLRC